MASTTQWARQLSDFRGKEVVFLSHCLLNENTRYLGGACERGVTQPVVRACIERGLGIVQMPCPEQHAWGGVLKRHLLRYFGSQRTLMYRTRRLTLPLVLRHTRWVYRRLARQVALEISDYVSSGFKVVGVVGVDGSPSCGSAYTLDIDRSLDLVATLTPIATRQDINAMILGSIVSGRGLFVEALKRELERRGLSVPISAFDLPSELRGHPSPPTLGDA